MITRTNVSDRLIQLGYTPVSTDNNQIDFELEKIINYTLNYCNISEIPAILENRLIDRVCSEFLFDKKNSGTLTDFDYEPFIKQIKEGDTTLSYATGQDGDTVESRFDKLVKQLEKGYDKWITPHRRLRW